MWSILKPYVVELVKALLPLILKKLAEQQLSTPPGTLSVVAHQDEIDVRAAIEAAIKEYEA